MGSSGERQSLPLVLERKHPQHSSAVPSTPVSAEAVSSVVHKTVAREAAAERSQESTSALAGDRVDGLPPTLLELTALASSDHPATLPPF